MKKLFWLDKNCSVCEQSRLFITEDITNERLYLHCEECEMAWLNPEEAGIADKGFLAINPNFKTRMPGIDKIQKFGWTKYKLKSI